MKICNVCKKEKELKEFRVKRNRCRLCENNQQLERSRSIDGLINYIYNHQKTNSKSRGRSVPNYTKSELSVWFKNQDNHKELFNDWKNSGYSKKLIPSVDRIDDYKGYSLNNIQIITFTENCKKPKQKLFKAVIQYDLNMLKLAEFESVSDASSSNSIDGSSISKVCRGVSKTTGGFIWRFK